MPRKLVQTAKDAAQAANRLPQHAAATGTFRHPPLPTGDPGEDGVPRVSVTYDVTSLSPEGAVFVEELEATDDEFLEDWRQRIVTLGAVDAGAGLSAGQGPAQ